MPQHDPFEDALKRFDQSFPGLKPAQPQTDPFQSALQRFDGQFGGSELDYHIKQRDLLEEKRRKISVQYQNASGLPSDISLSAQPTPEIQEIDNYLREVNSNITRITAGQRAAGERQSLPEQFVRSTGESYEKPLRMLAQLLTKGPVSASFDPSEERLFDPATAPVSSSEKATQAAGELAAEAIPVIATSGLSTEAKGAQILAKAGFKKLAGSNMARLAAGETAQSAALFPIDIARGKTPEEAAVLAVGGTMASVAGRRLLGELSGFKGADAPGKAPGATKEVSVSDLGGGRYRLRTEHGEMTMSGPGAEVIDQGKKRILGKDEAFTHSFGVKQEAAGRGEGRALAEARGKLMGELGVTRLSGTKASMQGVENAAKVDHLREISQEVSQGYTGKPVTGGGLPPEEAFHGTAKPFEKTGRGPFSFSGKPGEKAGPNIRLDKIETSEDVLSTIRAQGRVYQQDLQRARGTYYEGAKKGVIPDKVVAETAAKMEMDPKAMKEIFKKGADPRTALNEYELKALGDLHVSASEDLRKSIKIANLTGSKDADLARVIEGGNLLLEIEKSLTGSTATAGRATRVGRQIKRGTVDVPSFLRAVGGRKGAIKIAQELANMESAEAQRTFLKRINASNFDKAHAIMLSSMLSWTYGRVRDLSSNMIKTVLERPTKTILRGALVGHPIQGIGQAVAQLRGLPIREATKLFFMTWKARRSLLGVKGTGMKYAEMVPEVRNYSYRFEGPSGTKVSAVDQIQNKYLRKYGSALQTVSGDLIQAIDDASKHMSFVSSIYEDAYRLANGNVDSFNKLIAEPSEDMIAKADGLALDETWQNTTELSEWITKVRKVPGARWVVPFARVAANITQWGLEHHAVTGTVISGGKLVRKRLAGEAITKEVIADELVKPAFGALFWLAAAKGVEEGFITAGSPYIGEDDTQAGRLARSGGWQPYSISVGDTYYSYTRYPWGQLMASHAALAQAMSTKQDATLEQRAEHAIRGTVDAFLYTGGFRSMAEFFDRSYGQDQFKKLAQETLEMPINFIPGAFRQVIDWGITLEKRLTNEVQYKPDLYSAGPLVSVGKKARYALGFRGGIEPREDPVTGKPVRRVTAPLSTIIGPGSRRTVDFESGMLAEEIRTRGRQVATSGVSVDLAERQLELPSGDAFRMLQDAKRFLAERKVDYPSTRRERAEHGAAFKEKTQRLKLAPASEAAYKSGNSLLEKSYKLAWIEAYRSGNKERLRELEKEWKRDGFNFSIETLVDAIEETN